MKKKITLNFIEDEIIVLAINNCGFRVFSKRVFFGNRFSCLLIVELIVFDFTGSVEYCQSTIIMNIIKFSTWDNAFHVL